MKKNICLLIIFTFVMQLVQAKPVTPTTAKNLAISFYQQHSTKIPQTLTLFHTETSSTGEALYYVFNVNANDGFVIITADDAAHPILGYATEKQYVIPKAHTGIGYWMNKRKKEIIALKAAKIQATADIIREWAGDFSATSNLNKASQRTNNPHAVTTTSVAPMVQTTWDQSPYYNGLCPGGVGNNGTSGAASVTGCVATAMAQVMKYWNYPTHGISSSSYCDCTASGFTDQWGTLSVNYAATTYSWSAMPLSVVSPNNAVATLMYDCGVSVDMDYDSNESGADALSIETGGSPCSQIALVQYFGYDSTTIQGYQKTEGGYSDSAWIAIVERDLNAGRPVIYEGNDTTQGGHCWVCDGYDVNNNLHMNWGWSGYSDGYYSVTNLSTTGSGSLFNPVGEQEVLVGIQPPINVDAGITYINSPSGVVCATTFTPSVTLENFGVSTLTITTISYQIDANPAQTYTWTGSLAMGNTINVILPSVVVTSGTHTLTSATSNPNDTIDVNPSNNQSTTVFVSSTVGATLPVIEGFEGSTNLPAGWSVNNPNGNASWDVLNTVAFGGTNCIAFNNCDGDGANSLVGKTAFFYTQTYDFSSSTSAASMSFDVAYIVLNSSGLSTDTLVVLSSIDCGTTWNQLYKKGGANLASAGQTANDSVCWQPTSTSDWRDDIISLGSLAGQSNVMFAFENISDWGEWIYIDNINISNVQLVAGITPVNNKGVVNVYPNPAHDNILISTDENTISVSVTDIIGQTVIADLKVTPQQTNSIDISNLANGVYLIKVNSTDNQVKVTRFIKN
jgi:hypothetical protein